MVWIDVETTGLSHKYDPMIELGIIVTDRHGNERCRFQRTLISHNAIIQLDGGRLDEGIVKMHSKNGLFDEVRKLNEASQLNPAMADGIDCRDTEEAALNFLLENFGQDSWSTIRMSGASVQFDRGVLAEQMPTLHNWFHYRQHDVSTILHLADLADIAPDMTVFKRSIHRSIPDIEDEISVHIWGMRLLEELKSLRKNARIK